MDLTVTVAHGRAELRLCELVLSGHTDSWYGMCKCLRPLPRPMRAEWQAHADHWRGRLVELETRLAAMTEPTTLLPTLAAGSHPRLR